ncbi:rhomboid family intramembrane serine protease [Litchfieldia salsa]|uniref:Membrane associated serine protease, rhomboid family n=1 Tax=Litchfieldia salsa TaxID=930152 RepID=A0A1H0WXI5_9BACI|nr:rhomboid family intramembrane serine protease [Litchfieldia salsa]SDP95423.1 Membrane associated serine protease, rhomboid family [Litchfieldia salsa]
MFTRTESFKEFLRFYPIISIIIVIHIFLWILLALPFLGGGALLNQMVGYNVLITEGEYWRLITPIFVHASFTHMLFNSFSLVLFGPGLERMLGKTKFILIYLSTGVMANIATYILQHEQFRHVGSSGAIFGLFGLYLYMVLKRKDLINYANSQLIITILVIGLVMTFLNTNINIIGHLFGLIAGFLLAPIILGKRRRYL